MWFDLIAIITEWKHFNSSISIFTVANKERNALRGKHWEDHSTNCERVVSPCWRCRAPESSEQHCVRLCDVRCDQRVSFAALPAHSREHGVHLRQKSRSLGEQGLGHRYRSRYVSRQVSFVSAILCCVFPSKGFLTRKSPHIRVRKPWLGNVVAY